MNVAGLTKRFEGKSGGKEDGRGKTEGTEDRPANG